MVPTSQRLPVIGSYHLYIIRSCSNTCQLKVYSTNTCLNRILFRFFIESGILLNILGAISGHVKKIGNFQCT